MKPYGVLKLTATSPAQNPTEPLTYSELTTWLRLPETDPDTDWQTELDPLIEAAREQGELLQGRDLVSKQYDLTLDSFPGGDACIELRDNLSTVDLFQYVDSDNVTTTMVENTDYRVDTVRGLVTPLYGEHWPTDELRPSSGVLIRFTTATPAVSETIKLGMKHLISAWWEGRLPFELGSSAIQEYPYTVTALLSHGAQRRFA